MATKRSIRNLMAILLCLVTMLAFPAEIVHASEPKQCSITLKYVDGNSSISGATFRLYHVAEPPKYGKYPRTEAFVDCDADLQMEMTNEDWVTAANALADWVNKNKLEPLAQGETGSDGVLVFPDLEPGLYLISGDSKVFNDHTYKPQTFCVVVPDVDENGEIVYDVTIEPKYQSEVIQHYGDLVVTKTVEGSGGERTRDWHFQVVLGNRFINGRYGDMQFQDGVAAFTMRHGESRRAINLPAGTVYTVTELESNQGGYRTTEERTIGSIPIDGSVTATFVNRRTGGSFFPGPGPVIPDTPPSPSETPTPEETPAPSPEPEQPTPTPEVSPGPPEGPSGDSPKTGDELDLDLWTSLLSLSAIGLGVTMIVLVISKKKNHPSPKHK